MRFKWLRFTALLAIAAGLLNVLSCARSQQLVSIAISPSGGFVFGGIGAQGQFTAAGTYIHPPETKDITDKVVWSIDIANFATLTQTGQITYTRTDGCGSGQVSATVYSKPNDPTAGNEISATAPVSGGNAASQSCQ
jgi:hypothetical protein